MQVKDLKIYILDKVVLYKLETDNFIDIYNGYLNDDTPETALNLEIKTIGAKKGGIVDIRVE